MSARLLRLLAFQLREHFMDDLDRKFWVSRLEAMAKSLEWQQETEKVDNNR